MPKIKSSSSRWADLMTDPFIDIKRKIGFVARDLSEFRDAQVALAIQSLAQRADSTDNAPLKKVLLTMYKEFEQANFQEIVKEVSDATGADPEQIADERARTPEQQKAWIAAITRIQNAKIEAFVNSNYLVALSFLDNEKSIFCADDATNEDSEGIRDRDPAGFKESFLWYYFTTRPDIRPSALEGLTPADKEPIIASYRRFESFLLEFFGDTEKAVECTDEEFFQAVKAFVVHENPAKAEDIIEQLKSVLPKNYVMPNNKLANKATGLVDAGKTNLIVSRKNAKKQILTSCTLSYEGDENIKLRGKQSFTEYDRNVYDAVSSLYVYGDQSHIVTPAMVYRTMAGMTETEKPTPAQIEAVTRSLDKMRFIRAEIDCTQELQDRNITMDSKQINSGVIDTYLLAADLITVSAGGQVVKAYRILKTPILYEYSSAIGQTLTLKSASALLDIKELDRAGNITTRSLANTESRILIRGYLLRRIEGMKKEKNGLSSYVISLYDYQRDGELHQGLYSIAGRTDPTRTEAQRIRDDAEKMLAYWKATGYIKNYATKKTGKKITGITLFV